MFLSHRECHNSNNFVCSLFLLPSLQILMSVLKGNTTAERTPCVLTPLVPSCASATRATSGSMTIPAQVSPIFWPSDSLRSRKDGCGVRILGASVATIVFKMLN